MPRLYRICRNVYDPVDPTGAIRTSGRWHMLSQKVLYFSSSLALCILELKANSISFETIRKEFHYVETEVNPDKFLIEELPNSFYIKNWVQNKQLTQEYGGEWFINKKSPLLKVRSAVLPSDSNFVLNTTHTHFTSLNFSMPKPVPLDERVN